ncbi:hypothetical protein L9F63_017867, partial [Diploptera punctata]
KMNTMKVLCAAICLLGAFSLAQEDGTCFCTKFYIENVSTGLVLTYEPSSDTLAGFEPQGLTQQLWQYNGQMLYNSYNNKVLTIGQRVLGAREILLSDPSSTDNQKWVFQNDESIESLSGYTIQLYIDAASDENQAVGLTVSAVDDTEKFKITLSEN